MSIDHATDDLQSVAPLYHARLVGTVEVPLAGPDAFRLFTPIGEKVWAQDWDPLFTTPVEDDSQPGTVFEIDHHDAIRSAWVVCRREPGQLIHYARFIPGKNAGTIIVHLTATPSGSIATIEYELTALSAAAAADLAQFAAHYPKFLSEWEEAIAKACLLSTPLKDAVQVPEG